VDLSLFLDFLDRMRRIEVQGSTGTSPSQRATMTYASLLAMGLFINSQSLVGDGARILQWWRLVISSNVCICDVGVWWWPLASASVEKSRNNFLQSFQDNYFFPSMYVSFHNCLLM
jgi:hypothetical protein